MTSTQRLDEDIVKTDEGLVFNPYNPVNSKITLSEVQSILSKYGMPTTVFNLSLYERAFVHRSYTKRPHLENMEQNILLAERPPNCLPLSTKSNERLEFLGDGVLECVTKYLLYRRFPKADEGFMTEKKIAIVKNEAIGKIALEMGLHKWLIISKHAEEKKIRTNLKKLGCLFEAFIGALFLDCNKIVVKDEEGWFQQMFVTGPGFQMAQKFIENVFDHHIDWTALIQTDDNYKNILQVKIQKEFKVTPHYLEMGYSVDTGYRMGVYLCLGQPIHSVTWTEGIPLSRFSCIKDIHQWAEEHQGKALIFMGESEHKIKRKAEQMACNQGIEWLREPI